MRRLLVFIATSAALLAILAGGCGVAKAADNDAQIPPKVPALTGHSLAGTSWILVSYGDPAGLKSVIAGTKVTLNFNADTSKITGNGSVNGYGGDAQRIDNQLVLSNIMSTLMASTDQAINEQESAYFSLLNIAQSVAFSEGALTINCAGGKVLNFNPVTPAPLPSPTTCLPKPTAFPTPSATGFPPDMTGANGSTSTTVLPPNSVVPPPTIMVPPTPPTDVITTKT